MVRQEWGALGFGEMSRLRAGEGKSRFRKMITFDAIAFSVPLLERRRSVEEWAALSQMVVFGRAAKRMEAGELTINTCTFIDIVINRVRRCRAGTGMQVARRAENG